MESLVALLAVASGVPVRVVIPVDGQKVRSPFLFGGEQIFIYPVGWLPGRVDLDF